jgi:DNA-directed RNA polymerase subunit RPC12/RpoP
VSPASRVSRKSGCGVCSNKFLLSGFNDLKTQWPEIAKYYDNIRNPKDSSNIGPGNMRTDLWWVCDLNHGYTRSIAEQIRFGPKCEICRNKILLRGFNDLATVDPKLAAEWDEEKNGIAASDFIYKHHNKNFWWKCVAEGHSWETYFTNRCRTKQPTNCPYCSNKLFLPEFNSLSAMRPDIAEELDEPDITGWEIPFGSPNNYNWKCSEGHIWNVSVSQRCHNNSGCMLCSKSNTSVIETRLRTLVIEGGLMTNIPEDDNTRIMIPFGNRKYMRVDIVGKVAGKKCVIEYDSFHWHQEKYEIDNRKTNLLLNDGYIVIRIREQKLLTLEDVPASPSYVELLDVHPNSHNGIARIMERVEEALKTIMA